MICFLSKKIKEIEVKKKYLKNQGYYDMIFNVIIL